MASYFLTLLIIGLITYFGGIGYFGPQQKYKTMKNVRADMKQHPLLFVTPDGLRVTEDCPVNPSTKGQGNFGQRRFQDLEENKEDMEMFKTGLSERGLLHMWTHAEMKNAKNCVELKHGVPIGRLMKFAFFSQPGADDLSRILNANAAYTLCCGVLQMGFGAIILIQKIVYEGDDAGKHMMMIVPLCISTLSFLLSMANVLLDFGSILSQVSAEKMIADNIKLECDTNMENGRQALVAKRTRKIAEVEEEYAERAGEQLPPGRKVAKNKRIQNINVEFEHELTQLQMQVNEQLRIELGNFRSKLKHIKDIMKGTFVDTARQSEVAEQVAFVTEQRRKLNAKIMQMRETHSNFVDGLDFGAVSSTEAEASIRASEKDMEAKIAVIKRQLEALEQVFEAYWLDKHYETVWWCRNADRQFQNCGGI